MFDKFFHFLRIHLQIFVVLLLFSFSLFLFVSFEFASPYFVFERIKQLLYKYFNFTF